MYRKNSLLTIKVIPTCPIFIYFTSLWCSGSESCLIVYEGNASHWVVDTSKVPQSQDVYFQVAATNSLGQGPFSANSTIFNYIGRFTLITAWLVTFSWLHVFLPTVIEFQLKCLHFFIKILMQIFPEWQKTRINWLK